MVAQPPRSYGVFTYIYNTKDLWSTFKRFFLEEANQSTAGGVVGATPH